MSSRRYFSDARPLGPQPVCGANVAWVGPHAFLERIPSSAWLEVFSSNAADSLLTTRTLSGLESDLSAGEEVDAVLSPLFWRGGDGIEVARLLERIQFSNPYRIVTPPLPRPEIVLREIKVTCPSIDLDLIELTALAW
ncbi:MAG: hypothetical protein AAGB05_06190 [Pseudomonadota bacterium]